MTVQQSVSMPKWMVGPFMTIALALLALAGSFAITTNHTKDDSKHVNAELVEFRLHNIERSVKDIKTMLETQQNLVGSQ